MDAARDELLARSWTRSHEEDAGGTVVYRPSDWDFPPQRRPRQSLELEAGGTLRPRGGPAPDDRRTEDAGSWSVDDQVLRLRLAGGAETRYRIESVDEDRLVLRGLNG
jgi:hypothetical protein